MEVQFKKPKLNLSVVLCVLCVLCSTHSTTLKLSSCQTLNTYLITFLGLVFCSFWKDLLFLFQNYNIYLCISDACFDIDINYSGSDIAASASTSNEDCQIICQQNDQCKYWTLYGGMCHSKKAKTNIGPLAGANSGPKDCGSKYFA